MKLSGKFGRETDGQNCEDGYLLIYSLTFKHSTVERQNSTQWIIWSCRCIVFLVTRGDFRGRLFYPAGAAALGCSNNG